MNKALARPSTELALRINVHPLTDTLASPPYSNASIVYLAGNLHDQRKPGGLHFASPAARQDFVDLVVRGVRAPPGVRALGARLAERMGARVEGRRWVAAHLRRGDFVGIAWSPAKDAEVHFDKTRAALQQGVEELGRHFDERLPGRDDPCVLLSLSLSRAMPLAWALALTALGLTAQLLPRDRRAQLVRPRLLPRARRHPPLGPPHAGRLGAARALGELRGRACRRRAAGTRAQRLLCRERAQLDERRGC